ncbi:MAG: hypothetical protein SCARUB_01762 [Candidatus Scalindua rubra]|uniref:Uncharacterized protein n=1 Tax=Candidatus Scalindua rubra TaxID=1872076 RepID=A0A1E3XC09_9BACT|nr:MAG: hypothetical protein SCARUB_01762 [Candidatus Scalindua rubra]
MGGLFCITLTCHSEGGTTEESLYGDFTNLTKHHWLTNERFFAEFIPSPVE